MAVRPHLGDEAAVIGHRAPIGALALVSPSSER